MKRTATLSSNLVSLALFVVASVGVGCTTTESTGPKTNETTNALGAKVLETKPVVPPLKSFAAPVPQVEKLSNGLPLLILEKPGDPLETIIFVSKRGSSTDGDKPGLTSLTNDMLESGSAGRSAEQIAAEINALGTDLHANATEEAQSYGFTVLDGQVDGAANLLADIVLKPNFDPKEFERIKAENLAALVAALAEPQVLADEVFGVALYGKGPYGNPVSGTQASLQSITLDDIKHSYANVAASNSALVVAGGVPAARVKELLSARFSALPAGTVTASPVGQPVLNRPAFVLVDKPGAPQSVLVYGQPSVGADSPDRLSLELANVILGGAFTSRLNQNLREVHGYSYGAGSAFAMWRGTGPWQASSAVKTANTVAAVHEMQSEVVKLVRDGLNDEELSKAKSLFAQQTLVLTLQSSRGTAGQFAIIWARDLPLDELTQMIPKMEKLTAPEVNAAVQRALDPTKMTMVVAGDVKTVQAQLTAAPELKLPTPELWTDSGHDPRPVSAAASAAPATTPAPATKNTKSTKSAKSAKGTK
jgi:predicted Zn-dependent peptidase